MNQNIQFLKVKQLGMQSTRSPSIDTVLLRVAKHILREIPAEIGLDKEWQIDPSRLHQNVLLQGPATAQGISEAAWRMIQQAKVQVRKNASMGIELVFSLPPSTSFDSADYFADAMHWASRYFDVPLLSAVIHNDQTLPHMHVILLPLLDGIKPVLNASKVLGGLKETYAMHSAFHAEVGSRYGMKGVRSPQKRLSRAERVRCASAIMEELKRTREPFNKPEMCRLLQAAIPVDPEPLLAELGLRMPEAPTPEGQSFVKIMTKPVKPDRPAWTPQKTLIGDLRNQHLDEEEGDQESYPVLGLFPQGSNHTSVSKLRNGGTDSIKLAAGCAAVLPYRLSDRTVKLNALALKV